MTSKHLILNQLAELGPETYRSPGYLPEGAVATYLDLNYLSGLREATQEQLKGKKYFLVEDEEETAKLIIHMLASYGYLCIGYSNGLTGTQRLESIAMQSDFVIVTHDEKTYACGEQIVEFLLSVAGYQGRLVGLGSSLDMGYLPREQIIEKYELVDSIDGMERFKKLATGEEG